VGRAAGNEGRWTERYIRGRLARQAVLWSRWCRWRGRGSAFYNLSRFAFRGAVFHALLVLLPFDKRFLSLCCLNKRYSAPSASVASFSRSPFPSFVPPSLTHSLTKSKHDDDLDLRAAEHVSTRTTSD
jgi:hypothetical protein